MTADRATNMETQTNDRKIEHINAFDQDAGIERNGRYFDRIQLTHRAFPELNFSDIDPSCTFLGKTLRFPLLISSMTGGNHELIRTINTNLAIAAEHCGVAMGVGSQRVMFIDEAAKHSFDLREFAPNTILLGNIGAVQFNYGFGIEQCQAAVDILQADGLYLHLNPLQEAIQPEGDTNFSNLLSATAEIQQQLSVPVLIKEVGSGLCAWDVEQGLNAGVTHFDIAGTGGTSWSRIEYLRREDELDDLGLTFQDWGLPTPYCLEQLSDYQNKATFIASGGLRNGIDMVKSVILGASLCGMAAPFLKPATQSPEAVIAVIEKLKREFTTAMFLLGMGDCESMRNNRALIVKQ